MTTQFTSIAARYAALKAELDDLARKVGRDVRLIGVSKTKPIAAIEEALEAGLFDLGENYAQEFREKATFFQDKEARPIWHFIGHLQTNKVKYVVPHAQYIHSVDSVRLAEEIDKRSNKAKVVTNILLQVHTSGESTKFGCLPEELDTLVEAVRAMANVRLCGLMTLAKISDDPEEIRPMFRLLATLLAATRQKYPDLEYCKELSMGMTGDFAVAIEEGATMIRIGTAIFGEREYVK